MSENKESKVSLTTIASHRKQKRNRPKRMAFRSVDSLKGGNNPGPGHAGHRERFILLTGGVR